MLTTKILCSVYCAKIIRVCLQTVAESYAVEGYTYDVIRKDKSYLNL